MTLRTNKPGYDNSVRLTPGEFPSAHNGTISPARPCRSEVEVALGRLMASIEDAITYTSKYCHILPALWRNIVIEKARYDAARLSAGSTVPVVDLDLQEDYS